MATIPRQARTAQLVLFDQRLETPQWRDLGESTRAELIKLLAQLLLSVHSNGLDRAPQPAGVRDE